MLAHMKNATRRAFHLQLRAHQLLNAKHHTVLHTQSNRSPEPKRQKRFFFFFFFFSPFFFVPAAETTHPEFSMALAAYLASKSALKPKQKKEERASTNALDLIETAVWRVAARTRVVACSNTTHFLFLFFFFFFFCFCRFVWTISINFISHQ